MRSELTAFPVPVVPGMPVAHSSYETERVASDGCGVASDGCACAVWKEGLAGWRGDSSDPVPTANGPVPVGVE
ncbi:hypothetical protein PanWU01x14_281650 [Parasponia andersonii]|uniref:Uncharacterized protein n=1 Tax=Parasponia andersonii TaxID=3476 RepID=A0A2P5B0Q3_PARAD|nr:hypothetical protein PanWU01x14_281650 [Parasponia andersonii]